VPPTVFENIPVSCVPKCALIVRAENSFVTRNAIPDEMDAFEQSDAFADDNCCEKLAGVASDITAFMTVNEICDF
jgi:hypothetical protein